MDRYSDRKIILVKRTTRLEDMIKRFNTIEQAKFYIEALDGDFDSYILEDTKYKKSLKIVMSELEQLGNLQVIDRSFVSNFVFGKKDIIVAIGQDGMVANILKYLEEQPLIGVNPDSDRMDGVLLAFTPETCGLKVKQVIDNQYNVRQVTMAKVSLNDGQYLYAVNDLFIGNKSHVSFRYLISQGSEKEYQSSSGIIVATGLGSTGWMKSVITGAQAIVNKLTGSSYDLVSQHKKDWDTNALTYSVREPFTSKATSAQMSFGFIDNKSLLSIESQTSENGVIFSDGMEADYLDFNAGITATISIAEKIGHLVC